MIGDLQAGAEYEYQVTLDGTVRWPDGRTSDFPPSVLRTRIRAGRSGSPTAPAGSPRCPCRGIAGVRRAQASAPLADEEEHGPDAMVALALDLKERRTSAGPT